MSEVQPAVIRVAGHSLVQSDPRGQRDWDPKLEALAHALSQHSSLRDEDVRKILWEAFSDGIRLGVRICACPSLALLARAGEDSH